MPFSWSHYQQAIFFELENGNSNLLIEAVAGSGKTKTIVECTNRIPTNLRSLCVAFNKSIAEELKGRVPSHVDAKTFHSLGLSAVKAKYPDCVVEFDKLEKIGKEVLKRFKLGAFESRTAFSIIKKAVEELKNGLVDFRHTDKVKFFIRDYFLEIEDPFADKGRGYVIQSIEELIEPTLEVFRLSADTTSVDFSDMLYLPIILDISFPQYDVVFIDEVQDLNPPQHEIVRRCIKKDGRFIACGDFFQAIYAFNNADADSFNKFKNQPNTKSLPLSVCYRCGSNIIDYIRETGISNTIEAFEENKGGKIIHKATLADVREGDVVLSRMNSPLLPLACEMMKRGFKVGIKGSDFGESLGKLLQDIKVKDCIEVSFKLKTKLEKLQKKIVKENPVKDYTKDGRYVSLSERADCLNFLSTDCSTVAEMASKIKTLFSNCEDTSSIVLFSTVHKFKGLESDRVFIANPFMLGDHVPWAETPEQKQEERNIKYVAWTRAKKELGFLVKEKDDGKKAKKGEKLFFVESFEQVELEIDDMRKIN